MFIRVVALIEDDRLQFAEPPGMLLRRKQVWRQFFPFLLPCIPYWGSQKRIKLTLRRTQTEQLVPLEFRLYDTCPLAAHGTRFAIGHGKTRFNI
jgi:hypothetical protein